MPTRKPPSIYDQANDARTRGDLQRAESLLRTHLSRQPSDAGALALLGVVLAQGRKHQQAEYMLRRAHALKSHDPEICSLLGGVLVSLSKHDEAIALLAAVPVGHPAFALATFNRAVALAALERLDEAAAAYEHVRNLGSMPAELVATALASVLQKLGREKEARTVLRDALKIAVGDSMILSLLASIAPHADDLSPQQVFDIHAACARKMTDLQIGGPPLPARPVRPIEGPNQRLRIGFLSPDFREHSVAYFFEPLLQNLDRARIEPYVYQCLAQTDHVTRRLQSLIPPSAWRDVSTMDDPLLASRIIADQCDVLVDLAGYTQHSRVAVLSRRLAPLQVSAIGYPHSTCLSTIDLRIVDSLTDPPGAMPFATERLARLDPCFLCYKPPSDAPQVQARDPSAPFTFGSFSNIAKWSDTALSRWCDVLRALPDSRMTIKSPGLKSDSARARVLARFASRAVDSSRITTLSHTPTTREHLAHYHQIDVALDTFPYHGTTTTCEALLMGVPVLSLVGAAHAGRVGLSLLSAVGLPRLATATASEFFDRAVNLAGGNVPIGAGSETQPLSSFRSALRDRLTSSVLCDAPAYAVRWEQAIRAAWREAATT